MEQVKVPGGLVPRLPQPKRRTAEASRSRSPREAVVPGPPVVSGLHPASARTERREHREPRSAPEDPPAVEAVPSSTVAIFLEGFRAEGLDGWYRRRDQIIIMGSPAFFNDAGQPPIFMYKQASGRWVISPVSAGQEGEDDLLRAARRGEDRGVACQKAARGSFSQWREFHKGRWVELKLTVEMYNFEQYERFKRRNEVRNSRQGRERSTHQPSTEGRERSTHQPSTEGSRLEQHSRVAAPATPAAPVPPREALLPAPKPQAPPAQVLPRRSTAERAAASPMKELDLQQLLLAAQAETIHQERLKQQALEMEKAKHMLENAKALARSAARSAAAPKSEPARASASSLLRAAAQLHAPPEAASSAAEAVPAPEPERNRSVAGVAVLPRTSPSPAPTPTSQAKALPTTSASQAGALLQQLRPKVQETMPAVPREVPPELKAGCEATSGALRAGPVTPPKAAPAKAPHSLRPSAPTEPRSEEEPCRRSETEKATWKALSSDSTEKVRSRSPDSERVRDFLKRLGTKEPSGSVSSRVDVSHQDQRHEKARENGWWERWEDENTWTHDHSWNWRDWHSDGWEEKSDWSKEDWRKERDWKQWSWRDWRDWSGDPWQAEHKEEHNDAKLKKKKEKKEEKKDKKDKKDKKEKKEKNRDKDSPPKTAVPSAGPALSAPAAPAPSATTAAGLAATSPAQPAPVSATVKADPAVPLAVDVEELGGASAASAASPSGARGSGPKAVVAEVPEKTEHEMEQKEQKISAVGTAPSPVVRTHDAGDDFPATVEGFYLFLQERERIRLRRSRGDPWPWTSNPILQHLRLRNVKHEHDRSSIFIQRLLSERSEQKADTPALAEQLLNIGIWRRYGSIHFIHKIGYLQLPASAQELPNLPEVALELWRQGIHSCTDAYGPALRCHALELAHWGAPLLLADESASSRKRRRLAVTDEAVHRMRAAYAQLWTPHVAEELLKQCHTAAAAMDQQTPAAALEEAALAAAPPGAGQGVYAAELLRDLRVDSASEKTRALDAATQRCLRRVSGTQIQDAAQLLASVFEQRKELWPRQIEGCSSVTLELADVRAMLGEFDRYLRALEGRPSRMPFAPRIR